MKHCLLLICCSFLFYSFQYNGDIDYWKALKGIKNIRYQKKKLYKADLSYYSGRDFYYDRSDFNELTEIKEPRINKRICQFPKSAKKLDFKKIQLTGWITLIKPSKWILTKECFDIKNPNEWPGIDEKIILEGDFKNWKGQKITMREGFRLNKRDGNRSCYFLEKIEYIELAK